MSEMIKISVPAAMQNSVMEDEVEHEGVVVRVSFVDPEPPFI